MFIFISLNIELVKSECELLDDCILQEKNLDEEIEEPMNLKSSKLTSLKNIPLTCMFLKSDKKSQ